MLNLLKANVDYLTKIFGSGFSLLPGLTKSDYQE